jgi:hypothetical protein
MKALTFIVLGEERFAPGDSITKTQLKDAGQTDEQVQQLIADGALGEDSDELHPDHQPVETPEGTITATDGGSGK